MRRAPRTRFAASFVAIMAAGCAHDGASGSGNASGSASGSGSASAPAPPPAPRSTWSVRQGNDPATCWATPIIDCSKAPAGVTCNPPASTQVRCFYPMPAEGSYTILTYDGTHCTLADGKTEAVCPGADTLPPYPPPALPDAASAPSPVAASGPRRWSITAGEGKVCWAESNVQCDPAVVHHTCNPPDPSKVTCPPYEAGGTVEENDGQPGKCHTTIYGGGGHCPPHVHCNPPPPHEVAVPCPP